MIELRHVVRQFNGRSVLDDVSMIFEKGKTNLIIGGSGSGKTVLMKCMVGLFEVDSGEILYDGRNFSELNFKERKPIRQEIGMVFQGGALFDSMNVQENLLFPMNMFTSWTLEEKIARANFCLNRVNLVNANALKISELSGGMRKRVAIARAIVLEPKYLFCDEPNSGLDPQTSHVIDELIKEITDELNITTIINTHDMNSVVEIGEKIVYLYKGKKWWEGSFNDVLKSDNKELNDFVFSTKLLKGIRK
jgi:phospholipid/cholesterol/gamma-HCH transport system ATP-binding protein